MILLKTYYLELTLKNKLLEENMWYFQSRILVSVVAGRNELAKSILNKLYVEMFDLTQLV